MANGDEFKFGEATDRIMENMIRAIVDDHVEGEDKPDLAKVIRELEDMISRMVPLYRTGLLLSIKAMEYAPLAMGYFKQFSNLDREKQVEFLDSFEKSGNYLQRGLIMMIKSIIAICYFSQPEIEARLGYDHKCLLDAE